MKVYGHSTSRTRYIYRRANSSPGADGVRGYNAGGACHIRRSGKIVNWRPSDGTLLEFAETHGVAAPSSCRSGTCGNCESRILAGRVAYSVEPVAILNWTGGLVLYL
ncbi:hypothetical protein BZM26_34295 [Paraburkholderia strydomiana]|nr:hypothetical protein BZM26_34295 [Paraburkholderia strydomiana]